MSYENAPATKMLATRCIFCSKSLLDAESVEAGAGPTCREKNGYGNMEPAIRKQANLIIHRIAADRYSPNVSLGLSELRFLGLTSIADKIIEAIAPIKIEEKNGRLWIETPYLEASINDWRRIPNRIFDRESKRNVVPLERRIEVFTLLKKHYSGVQAIGPKGMFIVQ